MTTRRVHILLAFSFIFLAPVQHAYAEKSQASNPQFSSRAGTDDLEVRARLHRDAKSIGGKVDANHAVAAIIPFIYNYVLACPANSPARTDQVTCTRAVTMCSAGEYQYWLFRSPTGMTPPQWQQMGTRCLAPAAAAVPAPQFPGFTLADFQRLPLPAGRAAVQPDNGYTLVGVPTNVYADAKPLVLATQVVGFPVQVRAKPSHYVWSFGDGTSTGPTEDAGAPYPELRLAHDYLGPGRYGITLTTRYTGEYSVAGGAWLPIDGEAQVASAPVPVEVLSGRSALVGDLATG